MSNISVSWIKMIIKIRNEEPKDLMNRNEINMLCAPTPSLMRYYVFFKHLLTTIPCIFCCSFALVKLGVELHSPMNIQFCHRFEQFTKWKQFQKYFSLLLHYIGQEYYAVFIESQTLSSFAFKVKFQTNLWSVCHVFSMH